MRGSLTASGARKAALVAASALIATLVLLATGPAMAAESELPPGGSFVDDDGLSEEGWIEAIYAVNVTHGCSTTHARFCPDDPVTRQEMASFLTRALDLPPTNVDYFTDDDTSIHEDPINRLAASGITLGCDPPTNQRFCPERTVSRGEIASFLARGLGLGAVGDDFFSDDETSVHQDNINRLAAAGITSGCRADAYCPRERVLRRHMAVFLGRALELTPDFPPERPPPPYPQVGDGKRIIYSLEQHQVWLIDDNNQLVDTYPVTGRKGIPHVGTYSIFSKSVNAWAPYGGITMKHMVRFVRPYTWGNQWSYGFHSIPEYSNGQPMMTPNQLGSYGSGGCVRQENHKAEALYAWADIGDTVIVLP